MVSNIFYVHPYLGKISNLTNVFEMGWNHQPDCLGIFQQMGKKCAKNSNFVRCPQISLMFIFYHEKFEKSEAQAGLVFMGTSVHPWEPKNVWRQCNLWFGLWISQFGLWCWRNLCLGVLPVATGNWPMDLENFNLQPGSLGNLRYVYPPKK